MATVYGSTLNTPVLWINNYLQTKLATDVGIGVPIFPTTPSNIDDLTEQFVTIDPATLSTGDQERYAYSGVMATWDRLFRRRNNSFPHIKCEQLIYYFYATQENVIENMIQTQEEIFRLFDRGDESAEEMNKWQISKGTIPLGKDINGDGQNDSVAPEFYFHTFKVYQLEEVRDIIDFGTARTYGGNKIIIEFDYHQKSKTYNSDGTLNENGPLETKP